ncbi:MAG: RNA polymerase subunit sigma-24 [Chloroflexi bacterium]|nr:RNA polymerase subunit sigma-24 [Chloroflexota bacterium]MDL1944662.1 sigma-70 family RNA polymerase sigma factor [Chloroflexi bacterium CFX2]
MMSKLRLTTLFGAPASEADFKEVYQQELPRIYNFFRYQVGNDAIAEDLTADTFEKAWRNRERYQRDLSALSTWLFTIARRVAVDHYRKQRPAAPLEEIAELPSEDHTEDAAQQREDIARLSILLSRLAERERELVALKYGAGLTNRAIASLIGMTESNVGVTLHRVVQFLRSEWEAHP